jgi:hypothetical protein
VRNSLKRFFKNHDSVSGLLNIMMVRLKNIKPYPVYVNRHGAVTNDSARVTRPFRLAHEYVEVLVWGLGVSQIDPYNQSVKVKEI